MTGELELVGVFVSGKGLSLDFGAFTAEAFGSKMDLGWVGGGGLSPNF